MQHNSRLCITLAHTLSLSAWVNVADMPQALMTMTTLGVLCSMVHLRTLCGNRALLLREVESGVGVVPSYVAQVRRVG
jgi:hypothetical protein